jgi:Zn finger protein HypA/HybF involved in hydrogenase expression
MISRFQLQIRCPTCGRKYIVETTDAQCPYCGARYKLSLQVELQPAARRRLVTTEKQL